MNPTPGPWHYIEDGFIYDAKGVCVADPHADKINPDEREANAHAIAAVPELIAACRALINAYKDEDDCTGESLDWQDLDDAHGLALEAIAKALPETANELDD